MSFVYKMKLTYKLATMALLPLLGLLFFAASKVISSYEINSKISEESVKVVQLARLAVASNHLVHELQKERGLTAGFLASKGAKFSSKLLKNILLLKFKFIRIEKKVNVTSA